MCMCARPLSHVQLFVTLCSTQAPLPMEFFRQEYWSGLPIPPPGDIPNPGIKPASLCLPHWQDNSLPLSHLKSCTIDYTSLCHWFLGSCLTNSSHSINFVECNFIDEIYNSWKNFPINNK